MRLVRALAMVLSFAAATALHAQASDRASVSVVAQEMPGLIEEGKNLPYNLLLDHLISDSNEPVSTSLFPGYRGPKAWLKREHDCIFGGISAAGHKRPRGTVISEQGWNSLVISKPFNLLKVHAFSRSGTAPVSNLKDLKGKTIAVDQVLFFDLQFHTDTFEGIDLAKVNTAADSLNLLLEGRVNYVLAYGNDVALFQKENPSSAFSHDPDFTLLELEESMMCWPGPGVETFIAGIDKRLKKLVAQKRLQKYLPGLR